MKRNKQNRTEEKSYLIAAARDGSKQKVSNFRSVCTQRCVVLMCRFFFFCLTFIAFVTALVVVVVDFLHHPLVLRRDGRASAMMRFCIFSHLSLVGFGVIK